MMRKVIYIVIGAILILLIGVLIMYPINIWWADNFLGGKDDSGQVFKLNVFVLWPLFLILGGVLGSIFHGRRGRKKP